MSTIKIDNETELKDLSFIYAYLEENGLEDAEDIHVFEHESGLIALEANHCPIAFFDKKGDVYGVNDLGEPIIEHPYNEQIKSARKASGLTQKEVAERAAISLRYYQSIEAGQYWPTHDVLLKIAEILGKNIVIGAN